jgi:hypothetical protein
MNAGVIIGISSIMATLAAALIQKSWQLHRRHLPRYEEIEFGSVHETESFSALDVVKVLDLRDAGEFQPGKPGTAIYTDSYLIRRESMAGNGVVFRYATSGKLQGECVSHAGNQDAGSYESTHFPASLAIPVYLEHVAENSSVRVTNRIVYTGAFDRPDAEDFETHIERPMRSLTIILIFPRSRPCAVVNGQTQVSERGRVEFARHDGPVVADDGILVYWRIFPKKEDWLPIGAKYRLQWSCGRVSSASQSAAATGTLHGA